MKKKGLVIITAIIFIMLFPSVAWAETGIVLNGTFTDWSDKPYLSDPNSDESAIRDIVAVKWYPNNTEGNLYFYTERLGSGGKTDWSYTVYLSGDLGAKKADIYYKYSNGTVNVSLYDSSNSRIWSASGRWADMKNPGTKVEFYIPLSYLVSTTTGGYEISAYFRSGNDYVPNEGAITISSVSTAPVFIVTAVISLNVIFVVIRRKHKVIL